MCKNPPSVKGWVEVVCSICSHALEFGWVRLPLANGRREMVCNIWSHALEFEWVRLPLSNGQERSGLQHVE